MNKTLLLMLFLCAALALGALALVGGDDTPRGQARDGTPRAEAHAPEPDRAPVELVPPPSIRQPAGSAYSNVLWPLKVELELLEARFLPKQDGVPAIGSGATARLTGMITGLDDRGLACELVFVAGANNGRVLRTDTNGRMGASDLYPGLSIVELRGAGSLGARREVRLRRGQETTFNLGFSRPGFVRGKVQDQTGKGLGGASVVIDGTRITCDSEGGFYLSSVASGQVLCEVELEGYALYQELVWVAGGQENPVDRMTFTLKPAAELRIAVQGSAGGPGPVELYLFSDRGELSSSSAYRNTAFPWHKVNPIQVWPGQPITLRNLPPEVVKVHAFRPGARATYKPVNLAASPRDMVIQLEPAPTLRGKVLADGEPVAGARVRLEAPDRVRATLGYFAEASYFLETAVIPNLPPGVQETTSGPDGTFLFSAWADSSPVRYLEARGFTGQSFAGRFVQADEVDVVLELAEVDLGDAVFLAEFPGRHQGLPVEVWINGAPNPVQVLAAEERLEVADLVAGRWKVSASWHAVPVLAAQELAIDDVETLTIPLLPECIEGQDEEQWRRAGREYPRVP
jgi:hypothetical protein